MSSKSSWGNLVIIGEVARAHGRWGEVIVNPMTDFLERFQELEHVYIETEAGQAVSLQIEEVRVQKGRPVLKFQGVSSISEAERLAGKELGISESELIELPDGSWFHFQVIGCRVCDRRWGELGIVEEIMETGGTDVLVVRDPSSKEEQLIPFCREICRDIDIEKGQIEIDAPEGLVKLNAR
jgi:16S rRNA processing protein RimM